MEGGTKLFYRVTISANLSGTIRPFLAFRFGILKRLWNHGSNPLCWFQFFLGWTPFIKLEQYTRLHRWDVGLSLTSNRRDGELASQLQATLLDYHFEIWRMVSHVTITLTSMVAQNLSPWWLLSDFGHRFQALPDMSLHYPT